jgi:hypothetical protein
MTENNRDIVTMHVVFQLTNLSVGAEVDCGSVGFGVLATGNGVGDGVFTTGIGDMTGDAVSGTVGTIGSGSVTKDVGLTVSGIGNVAMNVGAPDPPVLEGVGDMVVINWAAMND